VHATLIATATVSLVAEPVLTLHIGLGLAFVAFVAFVVVHLLQRRRTSAALLARLTNVRTLGTPGGRLALTDVALTALTLVMLGSGLADWWLGHPTRIRWHAISGVLLGGFLLVHTLRRRGRLRYSRVR
jgi:hypothetical protein